MNKKEKTDAWAVVNGGPVKPSPELERLLRERFSREGKAERVARSLAALRASKPFDLTLEQLRVIAEDEDLEEQ